MSAAAEPKTCLKCGQPLGGLAPAGVCPRCLLLTGFDETNRAALGQEANRREARRDSDLPRRFGDYELLEEIARGGMGIVYKARQLSLDRIVAVKMLLFGKYTSEEFIHRFRIEASAAASLQHPNIVAIHEVGVHQGQHFFAMDFVDGPNLAQFSPNQPLPAKRAAAYVKAIAEAIQFAHQHRILHRDLKPSNVLIDSNDQPRITDFGLAKRFGVPPSGGSDSGEPAEAGTPSWDLTVTGQMLGSPNYMPPEQASVQRGQIGPHSDVYSMGAILYHALTGRPPFLGETLADTLQQVLHHEPIAPRLLNAAVPVDLETICMKCLERESSKRYPTAQGLADELNRFLRDEPIHARPVTRAERAWRWCRRNPALASSFALVFVLLLALGIGSPIAALRIRHSQREAEQNLYVANVHLANEALESHDLARARELLRNVEKSPDQRAMRGWEWRHLIERCRSDELATLGRHDSWLAGVAASADGKWLASISEDGITKLWDFQTRQPIASWQAHAHRQQFRPLAFSHALSFTPDSSTLITAGADGTIRFWEVPSTRPLPSIDNLTNSVARLAVSRDGRTLAAAAHSGEISLWKLSDHPPVRLQAWESAAIMANGMAFSLDGSTLFVGGPRPVQQYDISVPQSIRRLRDFDDSRAPLAVSPDGKLLAIARPAGDGVRLWSLPSLALLSTNPVRSGAALEFSPDNQVLASGLGNGEIHLSRLSPGEEPMTLHGHDEAVVQMAFSRDGRTLASASLDKTVRLWDLTRVTTPKRVFLHEGPLYTVAFSPDSKRLFSMAKQQVISGSNAPESICTLRLWNVDKERGLTPGAVVTNQVFGLTPRGGFSPDGRMITMDDFGRIRFHEVPSLEPIGELVGRCVNFAPDGGWLVHVSTNRIVRRPTPTGPETTLVKRPDGIVTLALSPDGRVLASSGDNTGYVIDLWDASTGQHLESLAGHDDRVLCLAFSPDGKTLASAGWDDGRLGVWDLTGQRRPELLRTHGGACWCVAFSPDGRTIASSGRDGTVRLWNVAQRQEIAVLHGTNIGVVAFSADGQWLASGAGDGTIRLWHAPSFEEIEMQRQPAR